MRFDYKEKTYDTATSTGETSTNRLQLSENSELQEVVARKYFGDEYFEELGERNELDVLFQFALLSARYSDILQGLTNAFSEPGTYPDWVISSAEERLKDNIKMDITDIIDESETDAEALSAIKDSYYDQLI